MEAVQSLTDRIASGDEKKVAILGVIRGAGKATTFEHLVRGLQDRGIEVGIAAAGREEDELDTAQPPRQMRLPARKGTVVATTSLGLGRATATLETVERTEIETPQGLLLVMRVVQDGEVEPMGPGAGEDLRALIEAVARHTNGRILVEGSFNRRGFAAPGIADGIILCVGAVMAPETERIVAGTRYYLDLFSLPAAEERTAEFYTAAESEGAATMLDDAHKVVGGMPWRASGNADMLFFQKPPAFRRLVVPGSVGDDFVIPLLREKFRFEIVVRDPMRISLSPVYYNAWQKLGGGIRVIHRTKVLALALNPTNPAGPDKDPQEFLQAFREGIPEIPSHDVLLEEPVVHPRKRWFGLGIRPSD